MKIQQFDFEQGWHDAEKGMALANGADRVKEWKERAERHLMSLSAGSEFTADDLVQKIGLPDEGENKNNVVGAWINGKRNDGRITFTGRFLKSNRVSRHTGLQRVWVVNTR